MTKNRLRERIMVLFQDITLDFEGLKLRLVREGATDYFIPDPLYYVKDKHSYLPTELPVFYNPLMEINRDLSILALRAYTNIINPLEVYVEALAGTGIRGFRVYNEVSQNILIIQNDINPLAYKLMNFNREYWNIPSEKMKLYKEDANFLLYYLVKKEKMRLDAIEIDPYGTPAPFLASTFNVIKGKKGLILITATDTAPLTGKYPNSALRKYAVLLRKSPFSKEVAVRALIYAIGKEATVFSKRIIPLFGFFTHHFIKIAAIVTRGKKEADKFWREIGWIIFRKSYFSIHRNIMPPCGEEIIGPLWIGMIYNKEFLQEMLNELKKSQISEKNKRILEKILSWEMEIPEQPFYYDLHLLASELRVNPPSVDKVVDALKSSGYKAVRTHFGNWCVRTNAPIEVLRNIVKNLA